MRFVEILTGGASPSDSLPLVVGIHGLGGRPENFGRVLSSLTTRARLVLPYGLEPYGEGFAWFLPWRDDAELAAGTTRAANRLAAMIDELVQRRPTAGKPIVTGFSEGGILSFALAVLHPESVRATFPVSGLLAPSLWPSQWPPGPRSRACMLSTAPPTIACQSPARARPCDDSKRSGSRRTSGSTRA